MTTPLALALKDRGITQHQLAETLGVTQATVSRKVSGSSAWKIPELRQVADLLGVSAADVIALIGDEGRAA